MRQRLLRCRRAHPPLLRPNVLVILQRQIDGSASTTPTKEGDQDQAREAEAEQAELSQSGGGDTI